MLWPLLLSVFLQQPVPQNPLPVSDEVEVVEVPSPLRHKQHPVVTTEESAAAAISPLQGLATLQREMTEHFRTLRASLVEVKFLLKGDSNTVQKIMTSGIVLDNFGLFAVPLVFDAKQSVALRGNITVYRTDGKSFKAELLARNHDFGISLLRAKELRGLAPDFGYGLWMEEGSVCIGLGHPFGLPNSMSLGFVTGRQRGIGKATGLLQITNPVNLGDRGGLLANHHGQVVGMLLISLADAARQSENRLKLNVGEFGNDSVEGAMQAQGISFALPIETIFTIFSDYFPQSIVVARRLGILVEAQIRVVENPGQEPFHVWEIMITGLMPLAPGELSGLQPGDVVLSLGGRPTGSLQELGVAIHAAQQSTTIVVSRNGQRLELPLEFEI